MIPLQSRYLTNSGGSLTRIANAAGVYNLTTLRTLPAKSGSFSLYVWSQGDRPDNVAYRFFQNPTLWWAIFDVNPELIDPLNVPPGTVVRIPPIPIQAQGTLIQ